MSREGCTYYVYMVASISRVLYCGMTNNLQRRVTEHREGAINGFSATYRCNRLVWFEPCQYVDNAISREKQIKHWRREKKVQLIVQNNPTWIDLSADWKRHNQAFASIP